MAKHKPTLLFSNNEINPTTGLEEPVTITGVNPRISWINKDLSTEAPKSSTGFDIEEFQPYWGGEQMNVSDNDPFEEQRARRQSGGEQLRNGFIKMLGTAGTTAIDGFLGTAAGLVNLAQGENYSDNPVTKTMLEWQQKLEESWPNYYTKEETESSNPFKGFVPGTQGSANFWGDKFMKNLGFTIGMALDGAVSGGILDAALGTSKVALKIGKYIANSMDDGTDIAKVVSQLKKGTLDVSKFDKAIQAGAAAVRRKNLTTQIASSIFSSQAESRFEAVNLMDQMRKEQTAKLDEELNGKYQSLVSSGYAPDRAQQIINTEKVRRLGEIEDAVTSAGNADFAGNMALLSATNFIQFRDAFSNGFQFNRKGLSAAMQGKINAGNIAEKGVAENIAGEFGKYAAKSGKLFTAGKILKGSTNALAEGFEEGAQQAIQSGSEYYYKSRLNPQSKKDAVGLVDAFTYGVQQGFGTKMGLEQVFIGALTGAFGVPTLGGKRGVQWGGGIASDIKEGLRNSDRAKAMVEKLNSAASAITAQKVKTWAAINDKEFDYKNADHLQFVNTVSTFAKAGKLDELVEQLEGLGNISGEEIRRAAITKDETGKEVDPNINKTNEQLEQEAKRKVSKLKEKALKIAETRESVKTLFPSASETIIDEIVYQSSTIDDVDDRIKTLSDEISATANISITKEDLRNSEKKAETTKALNDFIKDNPSKKDIKTKYDDLQKLLDRRDKFVDSYKDLTTPEGQIKLAVQIAKEEKKAKVEDSKEAIKPFVSKTIKNKEIGETFIVTKNNKTGEIIFTPVDKFGKHIKGNPTTVDLETFDSPDFQSKYEEFKPEVKPKSAGKTDADILAEEEALAAEKKKKGKKTPTKEEAEDELGEVSDNPYDKAEFETEDNLLSSKPENESNLELEDEVEDIEESTEEEPPVDEASSPQDNDLETLEYGSTQLKGRTANNLYRFLAGAQTVVSKVLKVISPYKDQKATKKIYELNDDATMKRYYKFVSSTKIKNQGFKGQILTGDEVYGKEGWKVEQQRIIDRTLEEVKSAKDKERIKAKMLEELPNTLFVVVTDSDGKFISETKDKKYESVDQFDRSTCIITSLPNAEPYTFSGRAKFNSDEDLQQIAKNTSDFKQKRDEILSRKQKGETVNIELLGKSQGIQNFGIASNNINTALDGHKVELRVNTSGYSVVFPNTVQHVFGNPELMKGRVVIHDTVTDNTYIGNRNKLNDKVKSILLNVFKAYVNTKNASAKGVADFALKNEKGNNISITKVDTEGKEESSSMTIFDVLKLFLGNNVVMNSEGNHSWGFISKKEGAVHEETGAPITSDYIKIKMPDKTFKLIEVVQSYSVGKGKYESRMAPGFEDKFNEWLNEQHHTVLSAPLDYRRGILLVKDIDVADGKFVTTVNNEFDHPEGYAEYLTSNTVNDESVEPAVVMEVNEGLQEAYKDLGEYSTLTKINQNIEFEYVGKEVPSVADIPIEVEEKKEEVAPKKKATSRKVTKRKPNRETTSEKTEEDIHAARVWFEKRFPGIPFNVVKELIDGRNWGQFRKAAIYIYEHAGVGTTYHEAWHVVTHLFLRKDEIVSIYNEYAKTNGLETKEWFANNSQLTEAGMDIEEKIANDFMDWKLGKPISMFKSRKQQSFFSKIWSAIKEFFGFKGVDIEEMFKKIDSGHYANAKIVYGINNPNNRIAPELGLSESQGVALNKSLTSMVMSYIFDQDFPERVKTLFSKDSNPAVLKGAYDSALRTIREEIEIKREEGEDELADLLESIISEDKFAIAKAEHAKYLEEELGIEVIEDDFSDEQTDNSKTQLKSESGIKRSLKDSTTNNMKLLISSLPNIYKDEDGDTAMVLNELGLQETCDFGFVFSALANRLAGCDRLVDLGSPSAMETRMTELRDNNEEIGPIIGSLMNRLKLLDSFNVNEITASNQQEFFQAFSRNYYDFYMDVTARKGEDNRFNSTQNKLSNRTKEDWNNVIGDTVKENPSFYVFDKEGSETVRYNSNAFRDELRKEVSVNERNVFEFLEKLGVKFTYPGKVKLLLKETDDLETLLRITSAVVSKVSRGQGDRRSYPILFDADIDTGMSGNVNYFAELEAATNPDTFENQHFGINGEAQFNMGLNSYETLIVNAFNNCRNYAELLTKCPFLNSSNCAYLVNSLMLKPGGILFNEDGSKKFRKIEYAFYDGSKGKTTHEAIEYRKLKFADKLRTRINSWLSDKAYFVLRPGDNDLERTLELGRNFISNNVIADREYHKQFYSYLRDELNQAINYKFSTTEFANRKKDSINGVMISLILQATNKESGPLSVVLRDNLEMLISDLNESENLNDATNLISEFMDRADNENSFQAAIEEFMDSETDVLYDEVVKNKLVVEVTDGIRNHGLSIDSKVVKTKEALKQELLNYVVNDKAWIIEQTKVFLGDPNQFKSLEDQFKRHSSFVSTKRTINDDPHQHEIMDRHMQREDGRTHKDTNYNNMGTVTTATFAEAKGKANAAFLKSVEKILGKKSKAYQEFDSADGQGIISLDEYRWMLYKSGQWSFGKNSMEELYQWEIQKANGVAVPIYTDWEGKSWKITKQPLLKFKPQKLQYAGALAKDGYTTIVFKLSVYPLTPSLVATNKHLENLNERMKSQQIGVVTFESGNKFGYKTKDGKANTLRGKGKLLTQETYSKFWGVQVDSSNKVKSKVVTGTQMMKQILSNMFANGGFKSERLRQLAQQYIEANDKRIELGAQTLLKKLDLEVEGDNYVVNDITAFKKFIMDAALQRNMPDNILDGISLMTAANGIDTLVNREKVENVLFALADATVISQKRHGNSAVLASGVMVDESLEFYKEGNAINPNTKAEQIRLASFFKEFPNLSVEDIRSMDPRLLQIIGFRIPTQAMSSIDAADITGDWLPSTMADMVVKPLETVAKAGEDYDFDKFNQYFPNYYATKDRPIYIEYGDDEKLKKDYESYKRNVRKSKESLELEKYGDILGKGFNEIADEISEESGDIMSFEDYSKKAIENKITELQREILLDKDNIKSLLSPVDSQNLSSAAAYVTWIREGKPRFDSKTLDEWYKEFLSKSLMHNILSHKFVTDIGTRFQSGNSAIGIGALFATFAIACQHAGATLGHSSINLDHNAERTTQSDTNRDINLFEEETTTGLNISDLFNEWLTTFVDAPKAPHMSNLGVNMQNVNTALYLTLSGVDPTTIGLFLQQPIIKAYLSAQDVNDSLTAKENKFSKMSWEISKKIIQELIDKNEFSPKELEKKRVTLTNEDLESGILESSRENDLMQIQVLKDFLDYQQQSKKVSEAMQAINVDTNGGGKNVSDLLYKLHLIDKLTEEEIIPPIKEIRKGGKLVKVIELPYIKGFSKIIGSEWNDGYAVPNDSDKSFLAPYFKAVYNLRKIYEPFVRVLRDPQLMSILNDRITVLSKDGVSKDDIVKVMDLIKQDLFSYLVTTTKFEIDGVQFDMSNEHQKLFYGSNNVAYRLKKLKKANPDNLFLKRMKPVFPKMEKYRGSQKKTGVQVKYYSTNLNKIEHNAVVADFERLKEVDPTFYYDLIKVSIMQTGLKDSPMSFWKVIPAETFNKIMTEVLKQDNLETANRHNFSEQVMLQNITNANIVPTSRTDGYKFYSEPITNEEGIPEGRPLPIREVKERTEDEVLVVNSDNVPINDLRENMLRQTWTKEGIKYSKRIKLAFKNEVISQEEVDSAEELTNPFEGTGDAVEEETTDRPIKPDEENDENESDVPFCLK